MTKPQTPPEPETPAQVASRLWAEAHRYGESVLDSNDARIRAAWLAEVAKIVAERDSAIAALADANEQLAAAREDAERWRACKVHGFPRPVYNPEHRINYWRVLNDDTFPVSPEAAIDAAIKALAAGKERT